MQATKGTPSSCVRLPITPPILDRLREHWQTTEHPNKLCLWAAATLCFAGFFHLGELLPSSIPQVDTGAGLQWGEVTVDDAQTPSMVQTHLSRSKGDQFSKVVDVYVSKVDGPRCPVIAVVAYMTSRGTNQAPFFLDREKKPLTKPQFLVELKKAFTAVGLHQELFAGHSFRIGAATAASQAGIPDSTIQTLGK